MDNMDIDELEKKIAELNAEVESLDRAATKVMSDYKDVVEENEELKEQLENMTRVMDDIHQLTRNY